MRIFDGIGCCAAEPCPDVRDGSFLVPDVDIDPDAVRVVLISESAPRAPEDFYYAPGDPLFARTTMEAFRDAGVHASSIEDLLALGVYCTTAVKCAKAGYTVSAKTTGRCSVLLERELSHFGGVRAWLLMGDTAIASVNAIAKREGAARVIPAGSTYRIRGGTYFFRGSRTFPSYLQAGPAFFVEKSKRAMIAADIASAMALAS
jgi:hypothetical protein